MNRWDLSEKSTQSSPTFKCETFPNKKPRLPFLKQVNQPSQSYLSTDFVLSVVFLFNYCIAPNFVVQNFCELAENDMNVNFHNKNLAKATSFMIIVTLLCITLRSHLKISVQRHFKLHFSSVHKFTNTNTGTLTCSVCAGTYCASCSHCAACSHAHQKSNHEIHENIVPRNLELCGICHTSHFFTDHRSCQVHKKTTRAWKFSIII